MSAILPQDNWDKIRRQKRAGILIPLFCVYSEKSIGIGDFSDLKLVIDWAAATKNSITQLLPLNELGITFCPYDSLSSFALEPLYLDFKTIPGVKERHIQEKIQKLK